MDTNAKYQKKYTYLKKTVKRFVYENAALCDEVFQVQERIICAKEELNYLAKRLAQHLPPDAKPDYPSGPPKPPPVRKREPMGERAKPKIARQTGTQRRKVGTQVTSDLTHFPIKLQHLSIHSLGEIVTDRMSFHTEDVIYPVGYCSTRLYGSVDDPTTPAIYTCMILDGGASPLFQISSDVVEDKIISGLDINAVHGQLLQKINTLGIEVVSIRGRGVDFFGLSHPVVVGLLAAMPASKKCLNFKKGNEVGRDEGGASVKFETLQRSIMFTRSQMETMRQQETLDSTTTLRDLLNS